MAPAAFHGLDLLINAEFWVPIGNLDSLLPKTVNFTSRDSNWLPVVARMKPGVTREQVTAPPWTRAVGASTEPLILDPGLDLMPRSFSRARTAGPEPLRRRNLIALPDFLDVA